MRSSQRWALRSLLWPGSGCIWVTPGQIYLCVGVSLHSTNIDRSFLSKLRQLHKQTGGLFLLRSIGGRIREYEYGKREQKQCGRRTSWPLSCIDVMKHLYILKPARSHSAWRWRGLRWSEEGVSEEHMCPLPTHPPILLHLVSISSCGAGRSGFPLIMPLFSLYVSFPHVAIVHWPH